METRCAASQASRLPLGLLARPRPPSPAASQGLVASTAFVVCAWVHASSSVVSYGPRESASVCSPRTVALARSRPAPGGQVCDRTGVTGARYAPSYGARLTTPFRDVLEVRV